MGGGGDWDEFGDKFRSGHNSGTAPENPGRIVPFMRLPGRHDHVPVWNIFCVERVNTHIGCTVMYLTLENSVDLHSPLNTRYDGRGKT